MYLECFFRYVLLWIDIDMIGFVGWDVVEEFYIVDFY